MGKYNDSGTGNNTLNPIIPASLWPGDEAYVWGTSFVAGQPPTPGIQQAPNDTNVQFEAVAVGSRSLAVALAPRPGGGAPAGIAVLIVANGNPGVMEVDVENAPADADGIYEVPSAAAYKITTWNGPIGPNGYYNAYAELQPAGDRFVSLECITNPNSVKLTAKISYV